MSAANYTRSVANQVASYGGLFNLIVGTLGNLLIILVFINLRAFRQNQCSFYLIVESCSNLGFLLVRYVYRIPSLTIDDGPLDSSLLWCKLRTAIAQACGLCSLFTISCMAVDQYLATHYQYHFRQKSTLKLAHRLTIFNVCFSVVQSTLFFAFYEVRPLLGCVVYEPTAKKYFSFFYFPVLNGALPVVTTTSMSLLAYRSVRRIVRRQIPVVRRRLDRQFTAMVLARVICLTVLGGPFVCNALYQLYVHIDEVDSLQLAVMLLVNRIVSFLLGANFSVNALV